MFVLWILLGFLILSPLEAVENEPLEVTENEYFESTEYEPLEATENKDKGNKLSRQPRDIYYLMDLIPLTTGLPWKAFFGYGRYCGPGKTEGAPVDEIDACCEVHDACYDVAQEIPCKSEYEDIWIYFQDFKYEIRNGSFYCLPTNNECARVGCQCDATLIDCLKANIDSYNPEYDPRGKSFG